MRILVVRLDGVGDALVCAPLVAALRAAGHTLGIALSTRNADVFADDVFAHTHVLERIPWPAHGTTPATWAPALARARAARYDAALVVSEEPDAYRFAREAGIARRVGFVNGWERPFKTLGIVAGGTRPILRAASLAGEREHECAIVFRLGTAFTAERAPTTDLARLRPLVLGADVAPRSLAPGAPTAIQLTMKWRAIAVDDATLVDLVRALARGGAVRALVAAAEAPEMVPIARAAGVAAEVFAAFRPWAEAIAGARALVSPDTGAVHVAGTVGTPAIVAWPDEPAILRRIGRWKPWAAPSGHVVVRASDEVAADVLRERDTLVGIS